MGSQRREVQPSMPQPSLLIKLHLAWHDETFRALHVNEPLSLGPWPCTTAPSSLAPPPPTLLRPPFPFLSPPRITQSRPLPCCGPIRHHCMRAPTCDLDSAWLASVDPATLSASCFLPTLGLLPLSLAFAPPILLTHMQGCTRSSICLSHVHSCSPLSLLPCRLVTTLSSSLPLTPSSASFEHLPTTTREGDQPATLPGGAQLACTDWSSLRLRASLCSRFLPLGTGRCRIVITLS